MLLYSNAQITFDTLFVERSNWISIPLFLDAFIRTHLHLVRNMRRQISPHLIDSNREVEDKRGSTTIYFDTLRVQLVPLTL